MKTKITFALIASALLMSFLITCALEEIKDPIIITFDSRGGAEIKSVTLDRGESLGGKYPTPAKTGSAFIGWYDGFTECTKNTQIYVDVTLVAHWEDKLVTVTFDSDNGTPSFAPITIPEDGILGVRLPSNPRRKGYAFENWAYLEDGLIVDIDGDTPIPYDITAIAQWKKSDEYTVSFDTIGGEDIPSIKVFSGDCIDEWENRFSSLAPKYTGDVADLAPATGKAFKEWVYDPDGQNIIFTERTPVTGNTKLIAQWRYTLAEETVDVDLSYCYIPKEFPGNNDVDPPIPPGTTPMPNHPLLNYPLPKIEFKDGACVFTFIEANSAIAIETSERLRELLLVANSVTVEIDGKAEPSDRLFRFLVGNTVIYAEGWNLTKNHSPDPMIPFEELKKKDLVIDEGNRAKKPNDVDYIFIQTNRVGATGQEYDTPTVATIKSIKITVK